MIPPRSIVEVLKRLKKRWKNPGAMEIGNPYRNLVAVMLSARTRDEQVLKLMPRFFEAFSTVEKLASATEPNIAARINTIGMYRQKARNLKKMAQEVVGHNGEKGKGEIPNTMDGLVALPGVGRKTASVVLVASFNMSAIAVDTHVQRVTNRLGWVKTKTPEETETALLKLIPRAWHKTVNRVFVKHGRYLCIGTPRCWACPVRDLCVYQHKHLGAPKNAQAILEDVERREKILESLRRSAWEASSFV